MKSCSKCERWKRDAEFYPDRRLGRSRDGLLSSCIACERESAAARARARYKHSPNPMSQARDCAGRFQKAA